MRRPPWFALLWLAGCAASSLHPASPAPSPPLAPPASTGSTVSAGSTSASAASAASAASDPATAGSAPPAAAASAPPEAPAPSPIAPEAIARLREQLDRLVQGTKPEQLGVMILEARSGQQVYASDADALLIPASNTKLFTTSAALSLLGASYRIVTRVQARRAPSGGEIDEVFLAGMQDFSWSRHFHRQADEPLRALAHSLRERGVTRITRAAWITGEPLWDPERFASLDPAAHRRSVASRWRQALTDEGIKVAAVKERAALEPTPDETLAEVSSEPLRRLCEPINQLSHNGFADALLRHLGQARAQDSSYAAGARVMLGWLESIGAGQAGLHFEDGSGLSRQNRVSARSLARLLRAMEQGPLSADLRASLAVAGERGTLTGRLPALRGKVLGKTGSLAQVVSTSGLLDHPSDGRTYVFALVANGPREAAAMRAAQDRIVSTLASSWSAPTPIEGR